ncbi:hypothetical protein Hanom_Chr16g01431121 [Helianthus anomalus]
MAPGKDNLADSVSILTQRQLDKFVRDYQIPLDLNPVLPSKDETIYHFCQGKFPFYTRVCNIANYRVPFSRFFIRVLQFVRVHICQVNPFGLSRINHFGISCRAQNQGPDLNIFRYFYEFITAGDWYTFAHRKGAPYPSGDERSSLKNWKDHFFWLDDRCLPVEMAWRFKDQTMSFDLGDDFHFLLLGRVCFSWGQRDRDWPVIRTKRERTEMSLRDAPKVPNFNVLDFNLDEQLEGEVPLMQQVASDAQEIRPPIDQGSSDPFVADATSYVPKPSKGADGSSGSQAWRKSILDDVDSDPEVLYVVLSRKALFVRGRMRLYKSVHPTLFPCRKQRKKKGSSHSSGDVMIELDEHISGGKSSRKEAAKARSAPTPTFSGGFFPVNEVESMEVENPITASKGDEKTLGEAKAVTFSGTILDSSLGPDYFIDDKEDQVSSLPPSWFGPELMSFFRYADVFSDDMEIDPVTTDEKFVPD